MAGVKGQRWGGDIVKPCGTPAAYRRHQRHGEKPCERCRRAEALRVAIRKKRRERQGAA
jgi:hypothetical protein